MLPMSRKDEHLYPVPKFDLVKGDVKDFKNELIGFHEQFSDCFHRSESREHFFNYMAGQFSELERKSIEPIALALKDGNVRALQRFVSIAQWDDEKIISKYRSLVNEDIGTPDGALIFDESGFIKKGLDSVGVARQYCGTAGKVDNCQVGVFAAYVSEHGYTLVDKNLFIPEKWFSEEYSDRRKKCDMPENSVFQTKPQLAAEMLLNIHSENILPFKYVLGDSIYGVSPEFIGAAESLSGITYFVSVPKSTSCWLKRPMTINKRYKWGGKMRTKTVLADTNSKPVSVGELAKNINDYFWYRRQVSEGAKGPIVYEFTRRRVILSAEGVPKKTVWLLIRRSIGDDPQYSYFISNAPRSTRLKTLVWLSGLRWAIEQCFEEAKTELGMDHYEVRKFMGWHHHILTCILAHFFLWHLKIRLGKKNTIYYVTAA
ncbi:MAG: IS701 family transposase [Desulfobacula sp.]|uniref:IS701 family transposase n=1 Tax=Desulfobacula sp. TaxID=2593537 RepID=UPI001D8BB063|nr:IS701 family transposase [Desulfobacula sp.]